VSLYSAAIAPLIPTLNPSHLLSFRAEALSEAKNLDGAHIRAALRYCHCERSEAIPAGGSSGPCENNMAGFKPAPT